MKNTLPQLYFILIISILFIAGQPIIAQTKTQAPDWDICIYKPDPNPIKGFVPLSPSTKARMEGSNRLVPCSTFDVTYNGFTTEAETAFQYAVDIWANSIDSPVIIKIDATFEVLGAGVLGSAGASNYWSGGSLPAGIIYPSVIADALVGSDIEPANSDITASFSSTFPFYFGTDGNTPGGQYDFVSVVLHEIGHGLGFAGFGRVDDNDTPTTGLIRFGNPSQYDQFIENGSAVSILTFADPSAALLTEFESDDLFSNAPSTLIYGGNPKIYAPATWNGGSSYSHWDESTYPAGNQFSLMTPQIGAGEAIHNPGNLSLAFLQDMGLNVCGDVLSTSDIVANSLFNYYPNPVSDEITITAKYLIENIVVYDILGQQIMQVAINKMETRLNLSELEVGIYFIRVSLDGLTETIKIIKN